MHSIGNTAMPYCHWYLLINTFISRGFPHVVSLSSPKQSFAFPESLAVKVQACDLDSTHHMHPQGHLVVLRRSS